jgi:methyl-accepting chemotaxis protein
MNAQYLRKSGPGVRNDPRASTAASGLAVQSLQFEDIVSQLLTHAEREIGEQDQVLADLRGRLQSYVDAVRGGRDAWAALCHLSDGLQALRGSAMSQKSTTVLQQSMDEGDVELF